MGFIMTLEYNFKDSILKSKKYLIIFLLIFGILSISMFGIDNFNHPKMEILVFILVSIIGIFCIIFYSNHDDDSELYKTAFLIIVLIGLLFCFLNPICNVSDELEHLARADITSNGILMPEYINNSYVVDSDIPNFFSKNKTLPLFEFTGDLEKIDRSTSTHPSAFQQNPFYGYLPQAIGIFIAKLLDLNVIWILWLGRICNLLCYAGLVALAVKKSPILKVPIIALSCIPINIYQAASVSIDAIFIGLGILAISYFFSMYKSEDNSLNYKNISCFSIICLLLGLCKLPFLATILLIFAVPHRKFTQDKKNIIYVLLSVIAVIIIGVAWSKYAAPSYLNSWRLHYSVIHNFNSTQQANYIIKHPTDFIVGVFHLPDYLMKILTGFTVACICDKHANIYYGSDFLKSVYLIFISSLWLLYPISSKINIKSRIVSFFTCVIIYIGTGIIQIITWSPVGDFFSVIIHARYFSPLFVLIPFVFGMNTDKDNFDTSEVDMYIILLTIAFIGAMLMQIIVRYY